MHNLSSLNNPRMHVDIGMYTRYFDSYNKLNTHYDLVFPYFIDYTFDILPEHAF
jgi:hypothetical protein